MTERIDQMSELARLGDTRAEELIDGKVVTLAPASTHHALVSGNVFGIFWQYLMGRKCIPISHGLTAFLSDKDHFVPDVMVVCDPEKVKSNGVYGAPDLVVEVLSPSTAKNDRVHKKDVYGAAGVREYWVISPGDRIVDVYRNEEGKLVLDDVYAFPPEWMLERMSDEERADLRTHLKCSVFDDLDISLDEIFDRID